MDRICSRVRRKGFVATVKRNSTITLLAIIVISILVAVLTVITNLKSPEVPEIRLPDADAIECPGFGEENCTKFYCHYNKVSIGPSCVMARNQFGFTTNSTKKDDNGIEMQLKNATEKTPYGPSFTQVTFNVTYLTEHIIRFQFKDAEKKRYEVPIQEEFPLLKKPPKVNKNNLSYEVEHTNDSETFNFVVKRKGGVNIWDSRIGALLLSDQYLQIGSYLPSSAVYGLGEHVHDSLQHDMNFKSWPMFARDAFPKVPADRKNLYGVHPFYTCLEEDGKSHGVFFLNSNAMEVTLLPAPAVTFRTIGGILDFFIFVGDNPEHVIQLYTSLIGRPMLPPYWALGFQLSRYGYNWIADLKKIISRNFKEKIPIAVQYIDIDHMKEFKDFTYDEISFQGLPKFIAETKKEHGLKWVIILDPAISSKKDYKPYKSGLDKEVFIKRKSGWNTSMFQDEMDKKYIYGKVWPPEYVVFPDFFQNSTKKWWKDLIAEHKKVIDFDALWIDMNEPSNFGTNEETPDYCLGDQKKRIENCWSLKCPKSNYEDPPYNPLLSTGSPRISEKTLCMESQQGDSKSPMLHYNVHSLYGWSQTEPTLEAVRAATKSRSFVISRSTYPSSGRYAGHWLGDNHSTYEDLKKSVIGIMEFNLFGIPYIGADVCGFFGDTSPHLCKRWMQLGAFYPYYRNHNVEGQWDQDPASQGKETIEASRKAIERRISMNPYLYTLFYKAHTQGNTVVRPLFHEFPKDEATWNIGTQFMWGEAMLISPILEEVAKSVSIYLPKAEWWRFEEGKSWKEPFSGQYIIGTDADEYTPVHIRGGSIIPFDQFVPYNPKSNTTKERNITLYVFPSNETAKGDMFADDGDSQDTIENNAYAIYNFSLTKCTLTIKSDEKSKFKGPTQNLHKVILFDEFHVKSVTPSKNFTTDKEHKSTTITVESKFSAVTAIKWTTTDGKC